jgi:hypothetical protein
MNCCHERQTQLLNVDLDILAQNNSDLEFLLSAIQKTCFVLNPGEAKFAILELRVEGVSLDEVLNMFCSAIESLEAVQRGVWDRLELRSFNIGIQAGSEPYQVPFSMNESTMRRLAQISASIIMTVYGNSS